jgi:hypothetical protein
MQLPKPSGELIGAQPKVLGALLAFAKSVQYETGAGSRFMRIFHAAGSPNRKFWLGSILAPSRAVVNAIRSSRSLKQLFVFVVEVKWHC